MNAERAFAARSGELKSVKGVSGSTPQENFPFDFSIFGCLPGREDNRLFILQYPSTVILGKCLKGFPAVPGITGVFAEDKHEERMDQNERNSGKYYRFSARKPD